MSVTLPYIMCLVAPLPPPAMSIKAMCYEVERTLADNIAFYPK
jgi:hypothetical protein